MSKVEERLRALAIAGYVAPRMRSAPEAKRKRRVKRMDKDGNVVGETTVEEIQKSLLAKQAIEFSVQEGVRPKKKACVDCKQLYAIAKVGAISDRCPVCRIPKCECGRPCWSKEAKRCRPCADKARMKKKVCVDCGQELGKNANALGNKRCRACAPKAKSLRSMEVYLEGERA